ncbi:hypothetical protein PybrP1_011237 [[Pythium] brassicae (nom. inval.)]|nr:hypothetical protein PybrP1_011237 [[Pythium] brassicae (nom. inval.)]
MDANYITEINESHALNELQYLHLASNSISSFTVVFPKLTYLHLSANTILELKKEFAFPTIETLGLFSTGLKVFDAYLPRLISLDLEGNDLKTIPPVVFSHSKLEKLADAGGSAITSDGDSSGGSSLAVVLGCMSAALTVALVFVVVYAKKKTTSHGAATPKRRRLAAGTANYLSPDSAKRSTETTAMSDGKSNGKRRATGAHTALWNDADMLARNMLRNVLVMTASGIVLFSREFVNGVAQPRLVGSLVTAMLEFSTKTTGAPVSHLELSNVSVTVATNDTHKVFCAMFHDASLRPGFSAFLARELLDAFVLDYRAELGQVGHNLRDFHRFSYRIPGVIRDAIKPILRKLQQQRGILKAIYVTDDAVTFATVDVDQIGVLANLQSLSSRNTCIQVSVVQPSETLIVMYKKGPHSAKNIVAIKECLGMLRSDTRCVQKARKDGLTWDLREI